MTAQHTPGPLTVRKAARHSLCGIISEGKYVIAETFSDIRRRGEGAAEEALANARLYAAAPDLLAALEGLFLLLDAGSLYEPQAYAARAAIAKAKGVSA